MRMAIGPRAVPHDYGTGKLARQHDRKSAACIQYDLLCTAFVKILRAVIPPETISLVVVGSLNTCHESASLVPSLAPDP